jgi:hypothetical protein
MSIALQAQVDRLEKTVAELEQKLGGMTRIELLSHLAQLELRIEALEQARKPGAKATRDAANG